MTFLRDAAQNPKTSPERLHELINLPGKRGDCDSDAGWCREYVAATPNVALPTLQQLAADKDDVMARRNAARSPALDDQSLWMMIEDRDDLTAEAARERLGPTPKLRPNVIARPVSIPVIDPKSGGVIRP